MYSIRDRVEFYCIDEQKTIQGNITKLWQENSGVWASIETKYGVKENNTCFLKPVYEPMYSDKEVNRFITFLNTMRGVPSMYYRWYTSKKMHEDEFGIPVGEREDYVKQEYFGADAKLSRKAVETMMRLFPDWERTFKLQLSADGKTEEEVRMRW